MSTVHPINDKRSRIIEKLVLLTLKKKLFIDSPKRQQRNHVNRRLINNKNAKKDVDETEIGIKKLKKSLTSYTSFKFKK